MPEAAQPKEAEPQFSPKDFYVIDGDSVSVGQTNWRLYGFNAPEIRSDKSCCAEERELARRAKKRLEQLIALGGAAGTLTAQLAPEQCDKYGRPLVQIFVSGQDVGEILISEGLALKYDGRSKSGVFCSCWQKKLNVPVFG